MREEEGQLIGKETGNHREEEEDRWTLGGDGKRRKGGGGEGEKINRGCTGVLAPMRYK
jgi:hypothetical protein